MIKISKFKVKELRTIHSPYDTKQRKFETTYILLVDLMDVPDQLPLEVNPREQKMTTSVAKKLKDAVKESTADFYLNNRGIIISVKDLDFNPETSTVTIDLGDQDNEEDRHLYGILDGGHTYKAIISERNNIPDDTTQYVRIEVIKDVQNITRLSDARNTSVQVTDIALFNLDDKFENIKNVIKNQVYADRVAFKDNEDKDLHVCELLKLMYAVDKEKYPDDNLAPIQSYSGKAQVFKRYRDAYNGFFYKALVKHIPKLVLLYDTIEKEIPDRYKEYKKANGVNKPSFGNVRGIETPKSGKAKTTFLKKRTDYTVSAGYIYPIFGAFRYLIEIDDKECRVNWMFDPIEIWNEIGTSLVRNTFEACTTPMATGKDKQLWLSNYRIVETQSLRKLLKEK